jgi:hypothetical protein
VEACGWVGERKTSTSGLCNCLPNFSARCSTTFSTGNTVGCAPGPALVFNIFKLLVTKGRRVCTRSKRCIIEILFGVLTLDRTVDKDGISQTELDDKRKLGDHSRTEIPLPCLQYLRTDAHGNDDDARKSWMGGPTKVCFPSYSVFHYAIEHGYKNIPQLRVTASARVSRV